MDELLALLGQHWRLLILYPGGLAALGATALGALLVRGRAPQLRGRISPPALASAALWLLGIALLPLPQTNWPYAVDVVTLALLFELPYWLWLVRQTSSFALDRAAALLGCYPLLALAFAALGQSAGSLVVLTINRSGGPLHWLGLAAWALALPPLLGLGPWHTPADDQWVALLRRTAQIGLVIAASLPANDATPRYTALVALGAALLPLAAVDRWWRGDPDRWLRWQPWLVAVFGLVIAGFSLADLAGRAG